MKRLLLVLVALMLLAGPLVVWADDQGWMPPGWDPTPPAQPSIDLVQLMQLLVNKGVINEQEYAQLTHSPSSSPAQSPSARGQTWNEVYRNPVVSKP
jgi:hypothetical protein